MVKQHYFELSDEDYERASRLHEESMVVDGLIATDAYLTDPEYTPHLSRGGVDIANFTVASYGDGFVQATEKIATYQEAIRSLNARVIAGTGDLERVVGNTELGVILGFQDTRPIGNDLWKLEVFAELGVRVVQLTYNEQNYVGAGCCSGIDGGLTSFGRSLLDKMNQLGLLVDLSHCGDQTTIDAIEYTSDPVAFTHIGVRELCDAPGRNKTADQLRTLAENGGVAGLSFFPPLVKREAGTHRVAEATVEDVLDHIDYAVDVMGINHVGIGTDLDDRSLDRGETPQTSSLRTYRPSHPEVYGEGPRDVYDPYPDGVHRHTELGTLTRGLVDRGYTDEEVRKVLGGNFLRLFEKVWKQ